MGKRTEDRGQKTEGRNAGILEWWNIGKMEYWSFGVMESWEED